MRTPVGSSNRVARSFAHSSPGWEPMGMTFTFCAQPGVPAAMAHSTPASRAFTISAFILASRAFASLTVGHPYLGHASARQIGEVDEARWVGERGLNLSRFGHEGEDLRQPFRVDFPARRERLA